MVHSQGGRGVRADRDLSDRRRTSRRPCRPLADDLAPFDFPVDQAAGHPCPDRARAAVPRTLSPSRSRRSRWKRRSRSRAATSSASARTITSTRTSSPAAASIPAPAPAPSPKHPIIFSKVPESVVANHAGVLIDPSRLDGDRLRGGTRRHHRQGRARHLQGRCSTMSGATRSSTTSPPATCRASHSQWLIGKSQDTFCPMGPWAVTARRARPRDRPGIRCFVNGELRQDSQHSQLIFDIPTIIATLSQGITLKPGDIIATGTPVGVGIGFDPPKYLQARATSSASRSTASARWKTASRSGAMTTVTGRPDRCRGRWRRPGRGDDPRPRRHVQHVPAADGARFPAIASSGSTCPARAARRARSSRSPSI